jgi:hypothetical protein
MARQAEALAKAGHARLRAALWRGSLRPLRSGGRRLVGSAGNAPVRRFRHIFNDARFTVGQPDHFPEIGLSRRSSKPQPCAGMISPAFAPLRRGSLAQLRSSEGW